MNKENNPEFKVGQHWWTKDGVFLYKIIDIAEYTHLVSAGINPSFGNIIIDAVSVGEEKKESFFSDGTSASISEKHHLCTLETDPKIIMKYNLDPKKYIYDSDHKIR